MRSLYTHPRWPEAMVLDGGRLSRWDVSSAPRFLGAVDVAPPRGAVLIAVAPDGSVMIPPCLLPPGEAVGGQLEIRHWEDLSLARHIRVADSTATWFLGAFSPDGRYLAVTDTEERLLLIDLVTDATASAGTGCMGTMGLVFSPDSRMVAAMNTDQGDGYVGLWPVEGDALGQRTELGRQWLAAGEHLADTGGELAFSPDGRLLAAWLLSELWWDPPARLVLFDVAAALPRWVLPLPRRADSAPWYTQVRFTPDGSGIVYGSPDDGILVRAVQDGQVLRRVPLDQRLEDYTPALDPRGRGVWIADAMGTPMLARIEGCGFR